jgi:hypothetical protein
MRTVYNTLILGNMPSGVRMLPGPLIALADKDMRDIDTSNCRAAMRDGKPNTMQATSHGRYASRDVRTAPPVAMPLCCFHLRRMFGVDPTYGCAVVLLRDLSR